MAREFDIIYRHFAHLGGAGQVRLSVGDDAAVLALPAGCQLVTSVDTMVAGVHFPEFLLPEDIAVRAVFAAASDLAAMGADPLGMTLALTLPDAEDLWLHSFSQGLAAAVAETRLPLVGGDTTRGPLTISINVLGTVPAGAAITRGGAKPGDIVLVSGTLGDSAAGLALLQGEFFGDDYPDDAACDYFEARFSRPIPRLDLVPVLRAQASAGIDISDGLIADAGHIANASGVAIEIESECLPLSAAMLNNIDRDVALRWALTGGEDYELLFTQSADLPIPDGCTVVGSVKEGEGVHSDIKIEGRNGFSHF